jgi:hypothetical protein
MNVMSELPYRCTRPTPNPIAQVVFQSDSGGQAVEEHGDGGLTTAG